MAVEYDFQAGLDISGLTSITQVQLMQAITQLAVLNKRGMVLYGTAAEFNGAFLADNPRCTRFVLIDTADNYNVKTWNGAAWVTAIVGSAAINAAAQISNNLIPISKLLESEATSMQVLHKNLGNTDFEYVDPINLFTAGSEEILLSFLEKGTAGYMLRMVGTDPTWVSYDPTAAITALAVSQLAAGTNGNLLGVTGGVTSWLTPNNAIADLAILLSKIAQSGAAADDLIKWNGSAWVPFTPTLDLTQASARIDMLATLNDTAATKAHGLGVMPKEVRFVAVHSEAAAIEGWEPGDEVSLNAFTDTYASWVVNAGAPPADHAGHTATVQTQQWCHGADATNIYFAQRATPDKIIPRTGGTRQTITPTQWDLFAYVWA